MARKSGNPAGNAIAQAKLRLANPLNTEEALQKLGAAGATPLARRLAGYAQTHPQRARAFGTIGAHLLAMAQGRPRTLQRAVLLYVPDGAYQMQVFAMDDGVDDTLAVCCEDVLKPAISGKVIAPTGDDQYRIAGSSHVLRVEQFDGRTENTPAYINAMTGWNRKAIRITLPADLTQQHVDAVLMLCALSAGLWKTAPVVVSAMA